MSNEKNKKILIVDNDLNTREIYGEVLKEEGFNVLLAADGVEGLDVATKEIPDLIFTGIIMPRMDGFTMIESLKKNVATSGIPVFVFSHLGRETDRQRANQLGVQDFIVRNVTPPREISERIKSFFAGGEFRLNFNNYDFDAPKLAHFIGVNSGFQCLECGEKMILKLKSESRKSKEFRAIFSCPHCGWELR